MKSNSVSAKINWEALGKDPRVRNALEVLTHEGAFSDRLRELLEVAACTQVFRRSHDLYFVDGMTRKQVADFPRKLRVTAEQIERIRRNPQLDLESVGSPAIEHLPATLRQYAANLDRAIRVGRDFMKKNPRYLDLASIFKLKLLKYVPRSTGAPRFSLVAELLHAAFASAGMEFDETDFDVGALRKLYPRPQKRQRLPILRKD
jgi:hypothetical protein